MFDGGHGVVSCQRILVKNGKFTELKIPKIAFFHLKLQSDLNYQQTLPTGNIFRIFDSMFKFYIHFHFQFAYSLLRFFAVSKTKNHYFCKSIHK